MNKYKKLGYNTFFLFIGNIGSKLISFLLLPFYTKYLSPELYGELNMVTIFITFLSPILTLEIAASVFRFANHEDEEKQNKIIFMALTSIIPIILFLGIILKNFIIFFDISYILKYYNFILIILIFSYISNVLKEKLRTNSKMKLYSGIGILETLLNITLNIILVPKYFVNGMIMSMAFSAIIISIILCFASKIIGNTNFLIWDLNILKKMFNYSFPLIPNAIIWSILALADRIFLKYYFGLEEVGIYSIANKIPMILTIIFNIFYTSLQITMLDEYRKKEFNKFYSFIFYNISLFQMLMALIVIVSIKFIVKFIVAEAYIVVWKYIPLFLITILFNNYSAILGIKYLLEKDTKNLLKSSVFASVANIIFNYFLVPKYKIFGAIIATLIAYGLLFFMRRIDTKAILKIENNFYLGNIVILVMGLLPIFNNLEKYIFLLNIILIVIFLLIQKKYLKNLFNYIKKEAKERVVKKLMKTLIQKEEE